MPELFDSSMSLQSCGNRRRVLFTGNEPAQRIVVPHTTEWRYEDEAVLFDAIRNAPEVDFYIITSDLAELRRGWRPEGKREEFVDDGGRSGWMKVPNYRRDNVIIGVKAKTQAEADLLWPALRRCQELCRAIWLDLRDQLEQISLAEIPGTSVASTFGVRLFVTAGGIDRPIHPNWVRKLRDACLAASDTAAFWFDGWGDWQPSGMGLAHPEKGTESTRIYDVPGPTGVVWPIYKVGREHSGHLLDGLEHRQLPVWSETKKVEPDQDAAALLY